MTNDAPPQCPAEKLCEEELCPSDLAKGQEEAFGRDIERLKARRSEFVRVECPACGSERDRLAFSKHTFDYSNCVDCHTLFMNPRPSPAVMESYYGNSENYQYWARYIFPASEDSRREKLHKPWLARILDYCQQFSVPRGTLVDVGAGFGTFCSVANAARAFQRVVAVEPTPEMAQACWDRGVEVFQKPIEKIGTELRNANVIVAFEVIEHLFEPRRFLEQCCRLMRAGGLLVLSSPNGKGFDIALLGNESLAIDPEHVNLFHPESLRYLVNASGFEVQEVSTPGRLDAEFVRQAVLDGRFDISSDPFLQRVLIDEWDRLGWPFQQFLAQNGLSSHMWLAAQKR